MWISCKHNSNNNNSSSNIFSHRINNSLPTKYHNNKYNFLNNKNYPMELTLNNLPIYPPQSKMTNYLM